MDTYFRYHIHSSYSLCDSTTSYKEYIDAVAKEGGKAICFSEHGNVFEWVAKKQYCDKKGVQYVHGMEAYLTQGLKFGKLADNYHIVLVAKNYQGLQEINELFSISYSTDHFFYKPRITFEEFLNISDNVFTTSACLGGPINKIPKTVEKLKKEMEECESLREGLALQYNKAVIKKGNYQLIQKQIDENEEKLKLLQENVDYLKKIFVKLIKKFNYLEIQHHPESAEQKEYNQLLYKYAKKYKKELIAATDTHSFDNYQAECRTLLIIDKYQKSAEEEADFEKDFDLTWKSYDELVEAFEKQGALPKEVYMQAIENTNNMLAQIEDFELDKSFKYNDIPGVTDTKQALQQRINENFIDKREKGIIPANNVRVYLDRIREEFAVLEKIGMTGFILFMSNLLMWVRSQGIPIGPCRGSVGGCLIAYICDIIDLDPIKRNTSFSRFANENRVELGDIDIDISPDQRQMVIDHIVESYPTEQTARVITFGTQKALGTIDALCRIYKVSIEEGKSIKSAFKANHEKLIKHYSEYFDEYEGDTLGFGSQPEIEYLQKYMEKLGFAKDSIETKGVINYHLDNTKDLRDKYPNFVKYYNGLFGVPVSQSMHPAGVIVAPSHINLYKDYGVMLSAGQQIISIDMDLCHDVSLVKYDILGLKNLQIMRVTCENAGIRIPYSYEMNWDDAIVWNHCLDARTGFFQFEKEYAFSLLKKFNPQKIDDLTLINAALRPSGASYRNDLIARIPHKNPSKEIDDLLTDNLGYLVYQEDIIRFLQEICGLSGSTADTVRRSIAHKKKEDLEKIMPQIIAGYCEKSHNSEAEAKKEALEFIKVIEDSSSYMFGRNHSTGYSMLSYKCVYFRTYFPAEFIVAYLNSAKDIKDIVKGDNLARELDISYLNNPAVREEKARILSKFSGKTVKPEDLPIYPQKVVIHRPTFGKSKGGYTFDEKEYAIYKGVSSIKTLSVGSADELYELSKKEQYQNLEHKDVFEKRILFYELIKDCMQNTRLNKSQLLVLIKLNFFEAFGPDKTLIEIYNIINAITGFKFDKINKKSVMKQNVPFLGIDMDILAQIPYRETPAKYMDINFDLYFQKAIVALPEETVPLKERLEYEFEVAGSYLSRIRGHKVYYYITNVRIYEDKNKPYIDVFNLKTGEQEHWSVTDKKYYINNKFEKGDILGNCKTEKVKRKQKVDGHWIETDQFKEVLSAWKIINKF